MRTILYDDYNSHFPGSQDVMGTITLQFGSPSLRHGYKIIEEFGEEKAVLPNPSKHFGEVSLCRDYAMTLLATDPKSPPLVIEWEG